MDLFSLPCFLSPKLGFCQHPPLFVPHSRLGPIPWEKMERVAKPLRAKDARKVRTLHRARQQKEVTLNTSEPGTAPSKSHCLLHPCISAFGTQTSSWIVVMKSCEIFRGPEVLGTQGHANFRVSTSRGYVTSSLGLWLWV